MSDVSLEPTVELQHDGQTASRRPGPRVELVLGAGPRLSTETQLLLFQRLRSVSAIISIGFCLFLVRQIITREMIRSGLKQVMYLQIGVMGALVVVTLMLRRREHTTLRLLRVAELVIFGLPGFFLLVNQYQTVVANSSPESHQWLIYNVMSSVAFWFALIFIYATFIPNTWQRAARVIAPMAFTPVLILLLQRLEMPGIRAVLRGNEMLMIALMMAVSAGAAIYATHIIGALRREAFEARQLGQYRLKQLLGTGGMGEVYLAEHMLLKRPCAIKLIHGERVHDPRALARFEREVRATAELSHWNTVEVYDYGRSEAGTFYYVMEYLPGLSLSELVQRYGPLPPGRVIYLLRQTCEALAEAHAMGLIHRDIKPGNIFAAKRGGVHDVAKLLDFGLVKPIATGRPDHLSQEGVISGSPLFMAPEQALGSDEPDARSDIYALGAVGYYLLTGQPPFTGQKPMQVLIAHARDPVIPPKQIRADLPADLEQVILRCLAKHPKDRYADARSLEQALSRCIDADKWGVEQAAAWWAEHADALPDAA